MGHKAASLLVVQLIIISEVVLFVWNSTPPVKSMGPSKEENQAKAPTESTWSSGTREAQSGIWSGRILWRGRQNEFHSCLRYRPKIVPCMTSFFCFENSTESKKILQKKEEEKKSLSVSAACVYAKTLFAGYEDGIICKYNLRVRTFCGGKENTKDFIGSGRKSWGYFYRT